MAVSDSGPDLDPYLCHRVEIEEAIEAVCRRQRLSGYEREEFVSEARLHLIENDHAVLRAFEGRSSFRTYLVTVVTHTYRDWRNRLWGKWRPSAEARRLGDVAVRLETMLVRDRLGFDQAEAILRSSHGFSGPRQALEAIVERLPRRSGRTFVGDEAITDEVSPATADATLEKRLSHEMAGRVCAVVDRTLAGLPEDDRLILRLKFAGELSVAEIARMLRIEQKPVYRRVDQLLKRLRTALEAAGITAAEAEEVIRRGGFDRFRLADPPGAKSTTDVRRSDRDMRAHAAGRVR